MADMDKLENVQVETDVKQGDNTVLPDALGVESEQCMKNKDKPGYAPIKLEFLDLDHVPKVAAYLPASTSEELTAMATGSTEKRKSDSDETQQMPNKKKMKLKGRNKKRPRGNRPDVGTKLCTKIAHGLECTFGDRCQYSHNIAEYVANKPANISDRCYVYETFGRCPYGIMCMFSKQHVDERYMNVVNESLYETSSKKSVLNHLDNRGDLQTRLWKKKYDFSKANVILKGYEEKMKKSGGAETHVDEAGDHVRAVCDVSQSNKTSHRTDSHTCCENHPGAEDVSGVGTVGLGSESCKLAGDLQSTGTANQGSSSITGDHRDNDESLSVNKDVSSNGSTVGASVLSIPTENEGIPDIATLKVKVQHAGSVSDEDTIKLRPLEKKKLNFADKLYLAPLTTVGNLPFRRLCKTFGADITCSEMAMSVPLLKGQQSEWAILRRHESEDIFGVQLCGSYTDTMTRCAQLLQENIDMDFVDINCGCPLDLVFKKGDGCALMGRTGRFEKLVQCMTEVLDVPLTVKMRTGIYESKSIAHNLIPRLRDWGVSLVTLHGRSREQRYTRLADWTYIDRCAKAAAPMPVFGNGDILSYEDANQRRKETSVAGMMIGRGALIKPWIFTEIKEQRHWDISSSERLDMLRSFTNYGLEQWGSDQRGVATTRRFLLEWLSFLYRYIPVGVLERLPQRINEKPPYYIGRDDLETLMASGNCADWVKISEILLGPVPDDFEFLPKHKANAYQ